MLATTKEISFKIDQDPLSVAMGSTLREKFQGKIQKKLDDVTNNMFKDISLESGFVNAIMSKENT